MIERHHGALLASATAVKIRIDVSLPKLNNLLLVIIVVVQLLTTSFAVADDFGDVKSNRKGDFVI